MPSLFVMRIAAGQWIEDTFDRTNGTSVVLNRSDGGLWTVQSGTPTISSNALTSSSGAAGVTAETPAYAGVAGLRITVEFTSSNPFQYAFVEWADGYRLQWRQFEAYLDLRSTVTEGRLQDDAFGAGFEDSAVHELVITHDYATDEIVVELDGSERITYDDSAGHGPQGDTFVLRMDGTAWTFPYVKVEEF